MNGVTVNPDFKDNRTEIVKDIPFKEAATDHPFGDDGAHNGGRI